MKVKEGISRVERVAGANAGWKNTQKMGTQVKAVKHPDA
jgi:hypothetical protein